MATTTPNCTQRTAPRPTPLHTQRRGEVVPPSTHPIPVHAACLSTTHALSPHPPPPHTHLAWQVLQRVVGQIQGGELGEWRGGQAAQGGEAVVGRVQHHQGAGQGGQVLQCVVGQVQGRQHAEARHGGGGAGGEGVVRHVQCGKRLKHAQRIGEGGEPAG